MMREEKRPFRKEGALFLFSRCACAAIEIDRVRYTL